MNLEFTFEGTAYRADANGAVDCSLPICNNGLTAWGIGPARISPYQDGDFIGSVAAGASVNFRDINFNPHAHGTHTECLGHITPENETVLDVPPAPWCMARVLTLEPRGEGEHYFIARADLEKALEPGPLPALVLRTGTEASRMAVKDWSGAGAPFLEAVAAAYLAQRGVTHLLIDLPSVDPESDGGALAAHKAFWGLPGEPRRDATITEFISVPDALPDGWYLLNLQMAPFQNDACPSRPLLFPLVEVR
ncbi:cyclase family protein [Robiginitalea sp. M366]|uniref:cyclase family protein n=1 Tax=Robiginitalea aestuariiviva TaxID=3036903 RepID=UPI00240E663F|nr:cyclase family protein [Robiginitalea aestuariiviva]MDG1571096.1 cyclase family protein [Robiginitalea aestuariiviva]